MKLFVILGVFGLATVLAACGDDDTSNSTSTSSGTVPGVGEAGAPQCAADLAPPETRQGGGCAGTWSTPAKQQPESAHVPATSQVAYCTNPPSSGPHYNAWAEFREYTQEVPAGNLVHSLEHGAVILYYKCETACPDIVDALRAARDRAPADASCEASGRGGVKRIIIAPSSSIPTRVAAAAWGATYTADCIDAATLDEFVSRRGGLTAATVPPEDLCVPGQIFP